MSGVIRPDGSESEGRSRSRLELELKLLKARPIVGNAYSDHDLLNDLPELAIEAASLNHPDLAFEAWDAVGPVVGVGPLKWEGPEGFVGCMTDWHDSAGRYL